MKRGSCASVIGRYIDGARQKHLFLNAVWCLRVSALSDHYGVSLGVTVECFRKDFIYYMKDRIEEDTETKSVFPATRPEAYVAVTNLKAFAHFEI